MRGLLKNLIALSAALVMPVQPMVTVCSPEAMAARGFEHQRNLGHGHDHSHHNHAHHSHGRHEHSVPHSHPAGQHGSQEHGGSPCDCGPQKGPDATIPRAIIVSSPQDNFFDFVGQPALLAGTPLCVDASPNAQPPPFADGQNALAISRGNPCALFCRWVI